MRIIAGNARGVTISAPVGRQTRPTTDRVRENIFNVLQNVVSGSRVLDAFAGSGALGIEALSRGAESAVFIEKDYKARQIIEKNLHACKLSGQVIAGDCLQIMANLQQTFDLIMLDPPYNQGFAALLEPKLLAAEILAPEGIIVWETAGKQQERFTAPQLEMIKETVYGDTAVLYYKRRVL